MIEIERRFIISLTGLYLHNQHIATGRELSVRPRTHILNLMVIVYVRAKVFWIEYMYI